MLLFHWCIHSTIFTCMVLLFSFPTTLCLLSHDTLIILSCYPFTHCSCFPLTQRLVFLSHDALVSLFCSICYTIALAHSICYPVPLLLPYAVILSPILHEYLLPFCRPIPRNNHVDLAYADGTLHPTLWPRRGKVHFETGTPTRTRPCSFTFMQYKQDPRGSPLLIYEIGAGNGTLMCNILDYLYQHDPRVYAECRYTVIEISPQLLNKQRRNMPERHRQRVQIIGKSVFEWDTLVPESCFVMAMEVIVRVCHFVSLFYCRDLI